MNWIKTKDKKPRPGVTVLGWFKNFVVPVIPCYMSTRGPWKRTGGDYFYSTPTHWCEIIPPEEK